MSLVQNKPDFIKINFNLLIKFMFAVEESHSHVLSFIFLQIKLNKVTQCGISKAILHICGELSLAGCQAPNKPSSDSPSSVGQGRKKKIKKLVDEDMEAFSYFFYYMVFTIFIVSFLILTFHIFPAFILILVLNYRKSSSSCIS